ncbi:MAG: YkgJ family cysteine cluster protein [Labilithrix sp.]|nr:YkgJ family cysteine cluster protein [Labilithrix sp.]MCW5817961.1 YkgJ family cysteine cluster protein [Labilithrix sp.]
MSAWIEKLHAAVDEVAAPVLLANRARLTCGEGCSDCCTDGLTVFALEAANIARHHAELLASEEPHPEGACAFLDRAGRCRVYAHRPYVCRTQGLPLRWIEEDEDSGEVYEARDICPKNAAGPPLEELAADDCWSIGPFEERLARAQANGERVALRSLFAAASSAASKRRLPVVE